jgi:hypothetical protein
MDDCNRMRAALEGQLGRGCCEHCHGGDELPLVRFRGTYLRLCCVALSEALRAGAVFQPDDFHPEDDLLPPRVVARRYPDSGVMRAWG